MIKWIGCPEANFHRGRPFGLRPEAVVVHIMDGSFAAGESVFLDSKAQKSAHYGISRGGEIHQYVDENDTAFHAGIVINPTWPLIKPRVNPNFYTIGIEHEGRADDEWPEDQLAASAMLIGQITARWNIAVDNKHIIRHHEIRASKTCPGNWMKIPALIERVRIGVASVPVIVQKAAKPASGDDKKAKAAQTQPVLSGEPAVSNPPAPAMTRIANPLVVRTTRKVNLRRGKPDTTAPLVREVQPHTEMAVCGFEIGQSVDGNTNWYRDAQGNYFWAGATDSPDPSILAAAGRARAGGIG